MASSKLVGLARWNAFRQVRHLAAPFIMRWPWPFPVRLTTGHTIYVDLRSAIGRGIMAAGIFDPALAEFITNNLSTGSVFIDVGANVGFFSVLAQSKIGSEGEVHAFETDPRSIHCLWLTRSTNRLSNMTIYPVALGEVSGTVGLSVTPDPGHTSITQREASLLPYPVLPLDTWVGVFNPKAQYLVKVDVEGAELQVLKGARQFLERFQPTVICEAVESHLMRFNVQQRDLLQFMESIGYNCNKITGTHDINFVFNPTK
jgi:FkbM family methyltransferase